MDQSTLLLRRLSQLRNALVFAMHALAGDVQASTQKQANATALAVGWRLLRGPGESLPVDEYLCPLCGAWMTPQTNGDTPHTTTWICGSEEGAAQGHRTIIQQWQYEEVG